VVHPRCVGVITRTLSPERLTITVASPMDSKRLDHRAVRGAKHFKDRLGEVGALRFRSRTVADLSVSLVPAYGLETDTSTSIVAESIWPQRTCSGRSTALPNNSRTIPRNRVFGAAEFLVLSLKANPNVLNACIPHWWNATPLGQELLALRERFLADDLQTFTRYALSQFGTGAGSAQPRRGAMKHAMHLIRLLITGATALREGRVPVRSKPTVTGCWP